ncbi:MAG: virulence protein [Lachnospiraceae bacterium]|nr:virulence protein [Lachnospiraceae bacterium]
MTINYNVTGTERKALVTAMGEILEVKPKYLGMPTASYKVDYFTVNKNGTVEFSDRADSEEVENLLEQLAVRGFTAEPAEALEETNETDDTEENAPQEEAIGFTITVPLDKVAVGTLTSLLDAKGSLIKKALGIDGLPIEISEDTVSFPWFTELPTPDECTAYTHLIGALCEMSRTLKRVTATERDVENEKYTFRCFLLRLGFIGDEYKQDRKILLRNLEGNSAWRTGCGKREVSD